MKRFTFLLSALVASSLLSACGGEAEREVASTPPSAPPTPGEMAQPRGQVDLAPGEGLEFDWENPIRGVEVANLESAAPLLAFTPVRPDQLGRPSKILVSTAVVPRADRVVAIRYDDPAYGLFYVEEEPLQVTEADAQRTLELLGSGCDPADGCQGEWSLARIRSGITALLVVGPASTFISWIEDGIRLEVVGPPETLTADEAVAIANRL